MSENETPGTPGDGKEGVKTPDDQASMMIYGVDDVPPPLEGFVLGLQHYLTMFGSTVAIPLIISTPLGIEHGSSDQAMLIATMFFVSGITTLLQTTIGNRLPVVQGGTFSFLAPTFSIAGMAILADAGWEVRMQHVQGAIITGSIVEMLIGYSGLIGKVRKYVGPITIAPTITLIGLALFEIGVPKLAMDWVTGGATVLFIIIFSQYFRKVHRAFELFPILLAIICAWGIAIIGTKMGYFHGPIPVIDEAGKTIMVTHPSFTDFTAVRQSEWFRIPYPFQWGMPQFTVAAFVGMLAGYVASMVESIGDYYAAARLSGAPIPTEKTISRGIGTEGLGCFIAGIIGTGNGTTTYSENIGAIGLTRVGSRRVIQYGALLMIGLGAVAKFGAIFTTIPGPIVGGMYTALFGMIAAVGLSNLQFVNLNSARNLFIIGISLFVGISMPMYFKAMASPDLQAYFATNYGIIVSAPTWLAYLESNMGWVADIIKTIGSTGMAVGGLIAFILDNTVPGTDDERGLTAWTSVHENVEDSTIGHA